MVIKDQVAALQSRLDRLAQTVGDLLHHFIKAQNLGDELYVYMLYYCD
jgi:hypothetical protein